MIYIRAHKLILATGNTSHYQRIKDLGYELNLENWKLRPPTDEIHPEKRPERTPGSAKGMISIADDFEAPLD